jgi:hypothetical protein
MKMSDLIKDYYFICMFMLGVYQWYYYETDKNFRLVGIVEIYKNILS